MLACRTDADGLSHRLKLGLLHEVAGGLSERWRFFEVGPGLEDDVENALTQEVTRLFDALSFAVPSLGAEYLYLEPLHEFDDRIVC